MKLWIKTYEGDKITRSLIVESFGACTRVLFDKLLKEAVDKFDLSTPVTLDQHFEHFKSFNSVKFLPRDFVELVDFDKFVVENASE